ncbi:MAG: hypothetical protein AAF943_13255 [Pseudomonadota bacterium]
MRFFAVAIWMLCLAGSAAANNRVEVPLGLWQTEPDSIGVVFWVRTRACGRSLCARVERAKNRRGFDAPSVSVGARVFWSMQPRPDGAFVGEYRDRAANSYLKSRVEVFGKELRLEACDDGGCRNEIWMRVR